MTNHAGAKPLSVVVGGVIAALMLGSPHAMADPAVPVPVPPPPAPAEPVANAVAPASDVAAPAEEGVPHLPSPENLPPGTSDDPVVPESRGVNYLRDLWHAVQTQEVSGKDALLLLTQRPLDPKATPPAGKPANPTPPQPAAPLSAPTAPEAAPAPAAPLPAPAPPTVAPPPPAPAPLMPFLP